MTCVHRCVAIAAVSTSVRDVVLPSRSVLYHSSVPLRRGRGPLRRSRPDESQFRLLQRLQAVSVYRVVEYVQSRHLMFRHYSTMSQSATQWRSKALRGHGSTVTWRPSLSLLSTSRSLPFTSLFPPLPQPSPSPCREAAPKSS